MGLNVRAPSKLERKLWSEFESKLNRLNARAMAVRLRSNLLSVAIEHAEQSNPEGICIYPWGSPERIEYTANALQKIHEQIERLNNAYTLTQIGEAGTRINAAGNDFDIVVDQRLPLSRYSHAIVNLNDLPGAPMGPGGDIGLGIAPLVIVGIVVFAIAVSAIVTVEVADTLERKYDKDIERSLQEADKTFCADPTSPQCSAWIEKRESNAFKQSEGLIDKLLGPGAGKKLGKGLAAAAAIALGVFAFSKFSGSRKA